MINSSKLTLNQCRLLCAACAEPKSLGELVQDAHINPNTTGQLRPYINDLAKRGLLVATKRKAVTLYAVTRAGEGVVNLVFGRVQMAKEVFL